MADGDEIHPNLPRRYLQSYEDLCSPDFDPEDTAHELAQVILKDVRKYGNDPIEFIQNFLQDSELPIEPLLKHTIDYNNIHDQIEQQARRYRRNPEGIELAKRTLHRLIEDHRLEKSSLDPTFAITSYLMNIQEARFSERVPQIDEHLNGLTQNDIRKRLYDTYSFSFIENEHLSKSILRQGDVNKRIHRRKYSRGLGLRDYVV